jgi:hypothetical protein
MPDLFALLLLGSTVLARLAVSDCPVRKEGANVVLASLLTSIGIQWALGDRAPIGLFACIDLIVLVYFFLIVTNKTRDEIWPVLVMICFGAMSTLHGLKYWFDEFSAVTFATRDYVSLLNISGYIAAFSIFFGPMKEGWRRFVDRSALLHGDGPSGVVSRMPRSLSAMATPPQEKHR